MQRKVGAVHTKGACTLYSVQASEGVQFTLKVQVHSTVYMQGKGYSSLKSCRYTVHCTGKGRVQDKNIECKRIITNRYHLTVNHWSNLKRNLQEIRFHFIPCLRVLLLTL